MIRLRGLFLIAAVVASTFLASIAASASATTAPSVTVDVPVLIKTSGIYFWDHNVEPRGLTLLLRVDNETRKPHNLSFLGHTSAAIAPGGSAKIMVFLVRRGRFLFRSTVDPSAKLRGYFRVI